MMDKENLGWEVLDYLENGKICLKQEAMWLMVQLKEYVSAVL